MSKAFGWAIRVVGGGFALLVFLASTSPDEAQRRTAAWINLPVVRQLPSGVVSFLSSPWTLVVTFLALGVWLGIKIGRWSATPKSRPLTDNERLASDLSDLAYAVEAGTPGVSQSTLSASNVMITRLKRLGYATPPGGLMNEELTSQYLHQLAAYLNAGDEPSARASAERLVGQWKPATTHSPWGY